MNKKKILYLILSVGLIFLFFLPRFINLDKRIGFDWDQEKISYEVKNIALNHKLTLLGPRANNDRGFFLGPHLAYLLIPFYFATQFYPSALMYFVMFYCLVFFIASYFILKKLFGLKITLFFLFLWSLNTLLIEADIGPVWPILMPLGVILTWYLLYRIYHHPKKNFLWLLLGLTIGFFLNMHFQFVFIGLFAFIFLLLTAKHNQTSIKKLVLFIAGVIVMFLPLIFFDLRHNFFNTSLFIHFFTDKDPNLSPWAWNWMPVFTNIVFPFVFLKDDFLTGGIFYVLITVVLILLSGSNNKFAKYFYQSALCLWLLFPIFFVLYGKRPSEYYFVFLYPFIILTIIDFFISRKLHSALIGFVILYSILNISVFYPKLYQFGFNFYQKDRAVKRIKQVLGERKCDIAFNVPLGWEVGYKYLFEYYNIRTIGDWKTCVININIPPRKGDEKFDYLGITLPSGLKK